MKKESRDDMSIIAFLILTWNSEDYIENCLDSILAFKRFNVKIYIVDNGSTDSTVGKIESFSDDRIQLIKLPENVGTTVSRNIALNKIPKTVNYICILDSDTIVNEIAFETLTKVLDQNHSIGIIGPQMQNSKGVVQNSGRNLPSLRIKIAKVLPFKVIQNYGVEMEKPSTRIIDGLQDVPYLLSACWVLRRATVDNIGRFDEKIFYAPEDVDYCVRSWIKGMRVVFCRNVSIIHEYQRISKKKLLSKINFLHLIGLAYYFKKYRYFYDGERFFEYLQGLNK